jgi:hypothetical protein
MNNYNIDTDAGIGSILSNFDSDYILHVVEDSLSKKFRPFDGPMPNMVDVLEREFKIVLDNAPDYREKILDTQRQTYIEIISIILDYYNLNINIDLNNISSREIYTIARYIYDVFVARYTDNMINFFTTFIINNAESIYNYLKNMENIIRPKDNGAYSKNNFIDEKFILIAANLKTVIYNIAGYSVDLNTLISYFFDPEMGQYFSSILEDKNDIYKYHYANNILSNNAPDIITRINLELQSRIMQTNINNN